MVNFILYVFTIIFKNEGEKKAMGHYQSVTCVLDSRKNERTKQCFGGNLKHSNLIYYKRKYISNQLRFYL